MTLRAIVLAAVLAAAPPTLAQPPAQTRQIQEPQPVETPTRALDLAGLVKQARDAEPLAAQALAAHIQILASDEFEGRGPASVGEQKTIAYIARQFEAAGLAPAGDNATWYQDVPFVRSTVAGSKAQFVLSGGRSKAKPAPLDYGTQMVVWTKRVVDRIDVRKADLVFVGYGVVAPEKGWNDYAGQDMTGKIAVILINDPDFETSKDHPANGVFGGRAMTYYGRWTYKFEEAARQGAAGAIIIHESAPAAYPWAVVQNSWTGAQFDIARDDKGMGRLPFEAWISTPAARGLFERAQLNFADLKEAAQKPGFRPVPMGVQARVRFDVAVERVLSRNVVGKLPGTDKPDEVVLYGAHWDHLGQGGYRQDGDDIYNGAVDNATGVAALIEIARQYRRDGAPRRTIAFAAWAGEEKGLLGSAYYAEKPLFAPAKTLANINMDGMAVWGRTRDVVVTGAGQNELEDWLGELAAAQGRVIEPEPFPEHGYYYRSDHFNLARIGVPAISADGGVDVRGKGAQWGRDRAGEYTAQRYHKPDDEYDPHWDLSGLSEDGFLLYGLGRRVANSDQWPGWKPGSEFKAAREASLAGR
jgi:Zn-dependent M28 family amino/carboxypeptidase